MAPGPGRHPLSEIQRPPRTLRPPARFPKTRSLKAEGRLAARHVEILSLGRLRTAQCDENHLPLASPTVSKPPLKCRMGHALPTVAENAEEQEDAWRMGTKSQRTSAKKRKRPETAMNLTQMKELHALARASLDCTGGEMTPATATLNARTQMEKKREDKAIEDFASEPPQGEHEEMSIVEKGPCSPPPLHRLAQKLGHPPLREK